MDYVSVNLSLSDAQKSNLMKGKTVQVSASSIGTGESVHMGQNKAKRLHKAKTLNKGCRLTLSEPEIAANKQQGGAIWDSVLNVGKNLAKQLAPEAEKLAKNVVKDQIGNLQGELGKQLPQNAFVQSLLDQVAKQSIDQSASMLQSIFSTVNGKGAFMKLRGSGFWDDLGKTVTGTLGAVGKAAAPAISQGITQGIIGKMNGKGFWNDIGDAFSSASDAVSSYTPVGIIRQNAINSTKDELAKIASGQVNIQDYMKYQAAGKGLAKRKPGRPRKVIADGAGLILP